MSIFGSIISSIAGKPKKLSLPGTPDYYTDPNFTGTQSFLKDYSENLLRGNIPDYYKGIGETMSPDLMKDFIYSLGGDVREQDQARQVAAGRARTGLSNNALAAVGQMSAQSRMADYLRAMQGKQYLMETGLSGETGVRSAAMTDMNQRNAFDQWKYNADVTGQQLTNASANARRGWNANAITGINNNLTNMLMDGMTGSGAGMLPNMVNSGVSGQAILSQLAGLGSNTASRWGGIGGTDNMNTTVAPGFKTATKGKTDYDAFMEQLMRERGL